jgi:hypothetical protein
MKICQEIPNYLKIQQKYLALCMKNAAHLLLPAILNPHKSALFD